MKMPRKRLPPTHPGELLRDELNELGLTVAKLARDIRIPLSRVRRIVNGRSPVTADTAMRLARYFGTSAILWMNLQTAYDMEIAQKKAAAIEREVVPAARSESGIRR
jgi:antitoxin HigA-1